MTFRIACPVDCLTMSDMKRGDLRLIALFEKDFRSGMAFASPCATARWQLHRESLIDKALRIDGQSLTAQ